MEVLVSAIGEFADPLRLGMLLAGVLLGLMIGVIPGLGGVFGLTILVPFTYSFDPISAFALLIGMAAVTTTSDTIPAVLLGVPGTVGSAATVIDGHEMARQGRAAEALGAAYMSSMIGGVFGALALAAALPMMRPLVLLLNYGDLLAITIFGLTLVALLSGGSQLRGLLAAVMGVMVSLIGLDPYEGVERWTFGDTYFWGGIPTAILFLGLFGLSELAAVTGRGRIQRTNLRPEAGGLLRGMGLALRHWRLVLGSSALGSLLGAVPGVGVTVIEWIAYGAAARHRGDGPAFGRGNVRGVIAPESANNSKEGGALLPTLAFGIPGSAPMAILLGAFAIHGIVPGPRMLDSQASLLIALILSVAVANIIGTAICLGLTPAFARIALVPARVLVPVTLVFIILGAFNTNKDMLDLGVLFLFGLVGIAFKVLDWPRPAFALGFVLGPNLERFFVLTYQISGWSWLTQPFVLVVFALILTGFMRRLAVWRKGRLGDRATDTVWRPGRPLADLGLVLALGATAAVMGALVLPLPFAARLFPLIGSAAGVALALAIAVTRLRPGGWQTSTEGPVHWAGPGTKVLAQAALLAALLLAFGHLLGPAIFVFGMIALGSGGRPVIAAVLAVSVIGVSYGVFDLLVPQTWPEPLVFGR